MHLVVLQSLPLTATLCCGSEEEPRDNHQLPPPPLCSEMSLGRGMRLEREVGEDGLQCAPRGQHFTWLKGISVSKGQDSRRPQPLVTL